MDEFGWTMPVLIDEKDNIGSRSAPFGFGRVGRFFAFRCPAPHSEVACTTMWRQQERGLVAGSVVERTGPRSAQNAVTFSRGTKTKRTGED